MKNNFIEGFINSIYTRTIVIIIAIVSLTLTVMSVFQDQKSEIQYEIIANTNVLDMNEDISKISVYYDSTDLKQTNENLRIITMRVINIGNDHIIKEYYDTNDPLRVIIKNGVIIETPEIIQTSSKYLSDNLSITRRNNNEAQFSQVILDAGEFYIVKLLILHKNDSLPELIPSGKIAGQKSIPLINIGGVEQKTSFLNVTFGGKIFSHLLRLLVYFIVGIVIFFLIIALLLKIENKLDIYQRKKLVKTFKNDENYQYSRMDDVVFDRYIKNSADAVGELNSLLTKEKVIIDKFKQAYDLAISKNDKSEAEFTSTFGDSLWNQIKRMINEGIILKNDGELVVNKSIKDTISNFTNFLVNKKELKKDKEYYHPQLIVWKGSENLQKLLKQLKN